MEEGSGSPSLLHQERLSGDIIKEDTMPSLETLEIIEHNSCKEFDNERIL